jgi:hypothetical protein
MVGPHAVDTSIAAARLSVGRTNVAGGRASRASSSRRTYNGLLWSYRSRCPQSDWELPTQLRRSDWLGGLIHDCELGA